VQYNTYSFEEYIRKLPPQTVFDTFLADSTRKRKILSNSVIKDIVSSFSAPENLETRFNSLHTEAKLICAESYLFLPQGTSPANIDEHYNEILKSSLGYLIKNDEDRHFIRGFSSFAPILRPHIADFLRHELSVPSKKKIRFLAHWQIVNDIAVTILHLSRAEFQLTRTGLLSKAAFSLAKKTLHFTHQSWKSENSTVIETILDYALRENILFAEKNAYYLSESAHEWFARSIDEIYDDFYHFCKTERLCWDLDMVEAFGSQKDPSWITTKKLTDWGTAQALKNASLCHFLGLLDIRKDEGEIHINFHKSPTDTVSSADQSGIMVLPDYTCIIPQEISPQSIYRFSLIGEIHSLDQVYKGKITKERLFDSLSGGYDESLLIETLEQWNTPTNIVASFKEWIREYNRVALTNIPFVISQGSDMASQLQSYEPLKELIEPVPADTIFKIKEGKEKRVEEILRSLGFDTRFPQQKTKPREELSPLFAQVDSESSEIVFNIEQSGSAVSRRNGGKYGSELKKRSDIELENIIDYAILMGKGLTFEYAGHEKIPDGTYTIEPVRLVRGQEFGIEGRISGETTLTFFPKTGIQRIGVISL